MTAKEMFEALGFELQFYSNGNQMCYEDKDNVLEDICFYVEEKNISTTLYNLPPELIKAIYKQCQELGWLDD